MTIVTGRVGDTTEGRCRPGPQEYEAWTRLHGRGLGESHGEDLRALLARLSFLELAAPILARALEPFPVPVRTLDALHLASVEFLVSIGQRPSLATYDRRLAAAASAIGIPLFDLDRPDARPTLH